MGGRQLLRQRGRPRCADREGLLTPLAGTAQPLYVLDELAGGKYAPGTLIDGGRVKRDAPAGTCRAGKGDAGDRSADALVTVARPARLVTSRHMGEIMRRIPTAIAVVVVAVAALSTFLPTAGTAQQQQPAETFTVFSPDRCCFQKFIDHAPKGPSAGDRHLYRGELIDPETGEQVAVTRDHHVYSKFFKRNGKVNDVLLLIDAWDEFEDGEIVLSGSIRGSQVASPEGATIAIVGGTGRYSRARGTVTGKAGEYNGEHGLLLTFEIFLD